VFNREHSCEWRDRTEVLDRELVRLRQDAAFVDPATGVGNLHQLDLQFLKLLGRWRRYNEPFTIALISLTDARTDADAEAEQVPPKAFAHLARILMETVRIEDTVCRASQNEFAVLLANSTLVGAEAFLERARNNIAREPIRTGQGSRYYRSAAGVAQWSDTVGSLPALLQIADQEMQRLYTAILLEAREYLPTPIQTHAGRGTSSR